MQIRTRQRARKLWDRLSTGISKATKLGQGACSTKGSCARSEAKHTDDGTKALGYGGAVYIGSCFRAWSGCRNHLHEILRLSWPECAAHGSFVQEADTCASGFRDTGQTTFGREEKLSQPREPLRSNKRKAMTQQRYRPNDFWQRGKAESASRASEKQQAKSDDSAASLPPVQEMGGSGRVEA